MRTDYSPDGDEYFGFPIRFHSDKDPEPGDSDLIYNLDRCCPSPGRAGSLATPSVSTGELIPGHAPHFRGFADRLG